MSSKEEAEESGKHVAESLGKTQYNSGFGKSGIQPPIHKSFLSSSLSLSNQITYQSIQQTSLYLITLVIIVNCHNNYVNYDYPLLCCIS